MRQYLSIDVLANWISMIRADVDGAIWLAGDDGENPFYELCRHPSSRVVAAHGVALELLSRVTERGLAGIVAVVPRRGAPDPPRRNVFYPDSGDVAAVLVASPACERVLSDLGGQAWARAAAKEAGPLGRRSLEVAYSLAKSRQELAVENRQPHSALESLVNWDTFELVPAERIHGELGRASQLPANSHEEISIPTDELMRQVDGRDAVALLAAATRLFRPRGIAAANPIEPADLLGRLRVAFDLSELEEDRMFWEMRRWERENPDYPLLRRWRQFEPLGVLLDQRYWERDLARMIEPTTPEGVLSAFEMDLDNFSCVNNELGHSAGDEAIRMYCKIVLDELGGVAEVYRRGGDEVVALAPGIDRDRALPLAEGLRANIEITFKDWSGRHRLGSSPTASIGVVEARGEITSEQIIQSMEEAQKRAKREGKNRVAFATAGRETAG